MSGAEPTDEELHAFLDGELPPVRAAAVGRMLAASPTLAARAEAFRNDRDRYAAAFAPIASAALPAAWLDRIEAAVEPDSTAVIVPWPVPRPGLGRVGRLHNAAPDRPAHRPRVFWAIAACLALIVGAGIMQLRQGRSNDTILADAEAAAGGTVPASTHYAEADLPAAETQRALLSKATGLPVRTPDLRRLGWRLVGLDIYRGAAGLHYADAQAGRLSVYVRRSAGSPRFDLLRHGDTRICVWQDEVVGAVMMGNLSAGQMMRVAGAAYADLDL